MGVHTIDGPNGRGWRLVRGAVSVALCGLLAESCGEKPDGGTPPPTPVAQEWTLPTIDTAADGADGEIYQALQKSCDDGDTMLTAKWQQSSSPRNVLLFAAGVQACRGAIAPARTLYMRAKDEYGWSGLGPAQSDARCDVYKSVASVVENAPRDRFPCPDGASPAFRRAPDGTLDDPRTPGGESTAAAVTTQVSTTAAPAPTSRSTRANNPVATRTRTSTPTLTNNNVVTRTSRSTGSGGGGSNNSGDTKNGGGGKSTTKRTTDMNSPTDMNNSPTSESSKMGKTSKSKTMNGSAGSGGQAQADPAAAS